MNIKAKDQNPSSNHELDPEIIVREHTEDLLKGALSLGFTLTEANDLVQNVWLTYYEIKDRFEGRSSIKTFLFGIMYNKARELRREIKKFQPEEDIETILDSYFDNTGHWKKSPINPEEFLLSAQNLQLIEDCINKLPLNQRMAFCLKEIDGHAGTNICNIMNISNTNLGVVLFRAKASLRDCIEFKANQK